MRIALGIEYNGKNFYGWQSQHGLPTIQGHLETALSKIANQSVQIFCAGRTDAGVHALGQVIHFDTDVHRDWRAWTLGVNTHLPPSISVQWVKEVDDHFHARFSATARRYCYLIYNQSIRSAIMADRATWYPYPLDVAQMHQGAQHLIGELDFSSFRSSQCESTTPMRNMHKINVKKHNELIVIELQANAFLHHMVRNIVGVLLRVGRGEHPPAWVLKVLNEKNRCMAAETAPATGLYLTHVSYPQVYSFPLTGFVLGL